jgi:hypothetical protein
VEADPDPADLGRVRGLSQADEGVHLATDTAGAVAQRDLDLPMSCVRLELVEETQGFRININVDAAAAFSLTVRDDLKTIDEVLEAHGPISGRK